jgi:uncharacterized membrane protein YeiH
MVQVNTLQLLDFVSTFAFAMVGARVAANRNMDYGGITFVAAVAALTGGTFRNLVLLLKPAWLEHGYLLVAILLAVLITIIFRRKRPIGKFILILDSISLGVSVVAAVDLSMESDIGILGSVVIGLLAATLGGLVRDVLCQIPPILLHRETIGTSCVLGALLCASLYNTSINSVTRALLSGGLVVIVRLLSVKFKINLPKIN